MTRLNQELIKSIVRRHLIPGIYVQIPMQEFGGEGECICLKLEWLRSWATANLFSCHYLIAMATNCFYCPN